MEHIITAQELDAFQGYLLENEKSKATIEKYVRELRFFMEYLNGRQLDKSLLMGYRDSLKGQFSAVTVNGKLSAIHAYLEFTGQNGCRVKFLKVQKRTFAEENRELTEEEYRRLIKAAGVRKADRLYHILLTLCGTGIRISELKFITVEAVKRGNAHISMKGKCRVILLQKKLREKLLYYIRRRQIGTGTVFRTRSGQPLDRSNIYHEMKKLCEEARVSRTKVFPHNLRHLFARTYYRLEKNLAYLADILGHSSIETTRIYVAVSAQEHESVLRRMRLVI